jgi:hypothetical protein
LLRQHLEPGIRQPQPSILVEGASGVLCHAATLSRLPSILSIAAHAVLKHGIA